MGETQRFLYCVGMPINDVERDIDDLYLLDNILEQHCEYTSIKCKHCNALNFHRERDN